MKEKGCYLIRGSELISGTKKTTRKNRNSQSAQEVLHMSEKTGERGQCLAGRRGGGLSSPPGGNIRREKQRKERGHRFNPSRKIHICKKGCDLLEGK